MKDRCLLVQAALNQVKKLRETDFRGNDDLVCALLGSYPAGESIANSLWAELPVDAASADIADLLSLWIWRTDDNGTAIMRAVESWITERIDPKQVEVALSLEGYPFIDDQVRIHALQQLEEVFPHFGPRCQEIIEQTRTWMKSRAAAA
jgi:hypothetical protein